MPSAEAAARETLDLPEPEGPSTATTRCLLSKAGKANGGRASAVKSPATGGELVAEPLGHRGEHGHLGEPEWLPQAVLEVQVLEVDAGIADVVQEPRKLAGLVGHEHHDDAVCRRRGAV